MHSIGGSTDLCLGNARNVLVVARAATIAALTLANSAEAIVNSTPELLDARLPRMSSRNRLIQKVAKQVNTQL
jgi:hypothetical protein